MNNLAQSLHRGRWLEMAGFARRTRGALEKTTTLSSLRLQLVHRYLWH